MATEKTIVDVPGLGIGDGYFSKTKLFQSYYSIKSKLKMLNVEVPEDPFNQNDPLNTMENIKKINDIIFEIVAKEDKNKLVAI